MFANEFFLAPIPPEEATPGIECPNLYSEFSLLLLLLLVPEPKSCSAEDLLHVPPRIPTYLESRIAGAITIPTPSTRAIPLIKTMIFEGSSHRNSVVVDEASALRAAYFFKFPLARICGENFLKPSIQDVRDTTALTARLNDDSASNATAALRYESKHSRSFSPEKMVSANALDDEAKHFRLGNRLNPRAVNKRPSSRISTHFLVGGYRPRGSSDLHPITNGSPPGTSLIVLIFETPLPMSKIPSSGSGFKGRRRRRRWSIL